MKTFKSGKNVYIISLLWITVAFLIAVPLLPNDEDEVTVYLYLLLFVPLAGILVWILLDTKYVVTKSHLCYFYGPFRGKIAIDSILRIENDDKLFKSTASAIKPGLAIKGMMVFYNKFDEIYISPADKQGFLRELKKVKPDLIIS